MVEQIIGASTPAQDAGSVGTFRAPLRIGYLLSRTADRAHFRRASNPDRSDMSRPPYCSTRAERRCRRCALGVGWSTYYTALIGALSSTLNGTFFALSDPTRRGILEHLARGQATISELAEPFGLTINGVKKHVGVLERADLVVTEKVGRARQCRLGSASMAEATAWIEGHRSAWESRLDRFERYVERTSGGGA